MGVQDSAAIVNPVKPQNLPHIGPVAVMAATPVDLFFLCGLNNFAKDEFRRIFISRLYFDATEPDRFSITGPFVGAPYAAMLLETLIVCGARKIIFIGWCGAIAAEVKIGDIILPTAAVIDEGTSAHYGAKHGGLAQASSSLMLIIRKTLFKNHQHFHAGPIWTTDALYRETRQQVEFHQQKGTLAVEMEISALYTVARYRRVDLGGILVVSDELSSLSWQPGFTNERFRQSRKTACRLVDTICRALIRK
jgi:purine-nucleoside phosphorylase